MSAKIYFEGAAKGIDSRELKIRAREGFRRLLERAGFTGKMPRLIACGGRDETFADFSTAHAAASGSEYVAMLVDSEDPVADIEAPWIHLKARDKWGKPAGATDDQALLMTTCMETWLVSDRAALRNYYGSKLKENALPALVDMETRNRHDVQDALCDATGGCRNKYQKGKRSFEFLGQVAPSELRKHLPSYNRIERILKKKL